MNNIEYFKYLLMALRDGAKNLKILCNLIVCLVVFCCLASTRFVPSGVDKGFLSLVRKKVFPLSKKNEPNSINHILKPVVYKKLTDDILFSRSDSKYQDKGNVVILLIAESLGELEGIQLFQTLESRFKFNLNKSINNSLKKNYQLISLPKSIALGGTFLSELSSLCSFSKDDYLRVLYNNDNLHKENFTECVPNLYKDLGYKTFYIHTAGLDLYARRKIMPALGFDQIFSPSEYNKKFIPIEHIVRCATKMFCSKPDKTSFDFALEYLNNNSDDNIFITLLTVDAHGPYKSNLIKKKSEIQVFKEKAIKSIDEISLFVENVLKLEEDRKVSILITSDHPPTLTSFINKYPRNTLRYNFSLFITQSN